MAIIGQNALLNQYVPTFIVRDPVGGQTLVYDSMKRAFVNACATNNCGGGCGGASSLGDLTNVSGAVDNPTIVENGQALVWNEFTSLWENQFIDYNTLLNAPTNSSFSFIGLSDTAKPSLPDGYVRWDSTGTQLIYSTTIPAASITGLATVAYTGDYNDLNNKPPSGGGGTVTSVSVVSANGVSGTVANPTTTPAITLTLDDITPSSVTSSGPIIGSNLAGTNTGDQIIVLIGDATNSDTSTGGVLTLATVNSAPGVYGDDHFVSTITVNEKGLVTSVTTQHVDTSVRDLIEDTETLTIAARHQYIVTSELQVDGYIINNGVIAIL